MKIWDTLIHSSPLANSKPKRKPRYRHEWFEVLADDINDCESAIIKAKQQLAILICERLQFEIDLRKIEDHVIDLEKLAMIALQGNNNNNAMESALKIAFYEAQIKEIKNRHARVSSEEQYISRNLQEDIQVLKALRQELNQARKTQDKISVKRSANKVIEIQETLCRIKSTQLWNVNHMEARQQLKTSINQDVLNKHTANNGPTLGETLASKVLERIREKYFIPV